MWLKMGDFCVSSSYEPKPSILEMFVRHQQTRRRAEDNAQIMVIQHVQHRDASIRHCELAASEEPDVMTARE
jgi:hypothetical protein